MKIEPGFHEITAAEYHSSWGVPVLSASVADVLLRCSPMHARHACGAEREESDTFDLGNAAHALILEGEEAFEVLDFPDWRTKAAQEARRAARAAGRIPLLEYRAADVLAMAMAVRRQCDAFEDGPIPLAEGRPEQTIVWLEGDVLCKARLDWLHDDHKLVEDLKTTESAEPGGWGRRQLYGCGADIQAAMYIRGVAALTGKEPSFRFVLAEVRPPYAVSVVGLDPAALTCAHEKVEQAIRKWRECVKTGSWPGYPRRTCFVSPPPWELAASAEREWDQEHAEAS